MTNVSQWQVNDSSNTSSPPEGAPEGLAPSTLNDILRAMMGALARWYSDTDGTLTTTGSGNAYVLTSNSSHQALADQSLLVFRLDRANTGAATLNVDGLGAKSMRINGAALITGQLVADTVVMAAYNATDDVYEIFGLVNADASKLTTGELPDARLSANVPLLDAATNTFTGAITASGTITGNLFSGSGASLTSLPAAQLTGEIADARLSANVPLLDASNILTEEGNPQIVLRAASHPWIRFEDSNASANEGHWDIVAAVSGELRFRKLDDADANPVNFILVTATANNVDSLDFTADSITANGSEVLTEGDINPSTVVLTSGTQSIGGDKTFTDDLISSGAVIQNGVQNATDVGGQDNRTIDATTSVLRVNNAGVIGYTGFTGGVDGRRLLIVNLGSAIQVHDEDAGSTAANRIILGNNSSFVTLDAGEAMELWYDGTSNRWRELSGALSRSA